MKLLLVTLLAAAQLTAQSPEVTSLLASSVADFKAHAAPAIADARNVRVGEYGAKAGDPHLVICGEVLPTGSTKWLPFATIKTSGYEQWLGGGSDTYCKGDDTTWVAGADLTQDMKRELGLK